MTVLLAFYLSGAAIYFVIAFRAFQQDKGLSPSEIRLSQIVLVIASVTWPVLVPLSCLEIALKHRATAEREKHTQTFS